MKNLNRARYRVPALFGLLVCSMAIGFSLPGQHAVGPIHASETRPHVAASNPTGSAYEQARSSSEEVSELADKLVEALANTDDTLAALLSRVEALESRVDDSVAQSHVPDEAMTSADGAFAGASNDWGREDAYDYYDHALAQQVRDNGWAATATSHIEDTVGEAFASAATYVDVNCRSTLCRLEVGLDETVDPMMLNGPLMDYSPWEGEAFVSMEMTPTPKAIMYLARDGHLLPQMEYMP